MRRPLKASLVAAFVAIGAGSPLATAAPATLQALRPQPVAVETPYTSSDYRFIGEAIGDRPVVALGESIHVTREMPLVRLNLLRYLHEERGMSVLALEGSLIDAWTAQEHAYRSAAPPYERARRFSREALFGLWQTDEMEQVIAYALATQAGPRPLYLTSFDLQPGSARAYGGSSERSLDAFLTALRSVDPQLEEPRVRRWSQLLGPALGCRGVLRDDAPVRELEQWIQARGVQAIGRRRPAPHVEALRLVPLMVRNRLRQCAEWQRAGSAMQVYQRSRDVLNAQLTIALLRSMPRMVLWAHHSHLHYNSLAGSVPSMGQHLRSALGDRLYTIGVFANGGTALDSLRADRASGIAMPFQLASRPLPSGERFGVERRLASLSDRDFFVDLRQAPVEWARPDFSRMEVDGRMPTALSRDFDGAILLHNVTGAELNFLPPAFAMALRWAGWILRHPILAALIGLLLLAALGLGIRNLWRRWRARRARRRTQPA